MSDLDVRSYLKGKGLETRTSGKEVIVPCFFICGESGSSTKKKLYVNIEHGAFQCKVCQTQGSWKMLMEHFGDAVENTPHAKPSRKLLINEEYTRVAQDALMRNERALAYLYGRGLTPESIEEARLGYHPKGVSLVKSLPSALQEGGFTMGELRDSGLLTAHGRDFHEGRIIIPYLSSGQVLQVRGRALDPSDQIRYATPPGDPVRLYNSDSLRGADTALVCEGEMDLLLLQQTLRNSPDARARNIALVAIPGVGALPGGKEEFAEWFEGARRVYIGLDNDSAGKQAAGKVKDLLKTKARTIELEDVKDWGEYIEAGKGWRDVLGLITEADMLGKRVFSITEARQALIKLRNAAPGIKTGYRSLDALIEPGLLPGQLSVPVAKTGNGKSLWLSAVAWNARAIPSLYITLELTKEETVARFDRISRFFDPTYSDDQVDQEISLLGVVDENRLGPDDFGVLIEEFAEEKGERPRLVFVDYLGYYARGMRGKDLYERTTNAVMQLKELAKQFQVHIMCPSQVNRGVKQGELITLEALRDSGAVEETADFILGISRPHLALADANSRGSVGSELKINLPKSRHGNQNRVASLHLAPLSLAIVDDLDTVNVQRVQQEVEAYNRGEKYEDFIARRRQAAWKTKQGTFAPDNKEKASGSHN